MKSRVYTDTSYSEKVLQGVFDSWPAVSRVAGLPNWLEKATIRGTTAEQFADPFGRGFRPDAVGTTEEWNILLELKYGRKWEPIGLAEALHHAEALEQLPNLVAPWQRGRPLVAVVVGQWSPWTRLALDRLRRSGLAIDALRFVEVVALQRDDGCSWLWFEEYLGDDAWLDDPLPVGLLDRLVDALPCLNVGNYKWRKRRDAATWLASGSGRSSANVAVSRTADGNWLAWSGHDRVGKDALPEEYWLVEG